MSKKLVMALDESGSFGTKGNYFVIAGIITDNAKPLQNVMRRSAKATKEKFPEFQDHTEIKAAHSYLVIRDYFLRRICSKDIEIRYIVADKRHVFQRLLDDQNVFYNYMLKLLIMPIVRTKKIDELEILIDRRSIKVASGNSFEDYIKAEIWGELGSKMDITVRYPESHASKLVQAADFVAHSVYCNYEYEKDHCYQLMQPKIVVGERFPRHAFGTPKVVAI